MERVGDQWHGAAGGPESAGMDQGSVPEVGPGCVCAHVQVDRVTETGRCISTVCQSSSCAINLFGSLEAFFK